MKTRDQDHADIGCLEVVEQLYSLLDGEVSDPQTLRTEILRLRDTALVCATERVYESLPIPRVTRVPGTKNFILGLANVRGNLITVIDLGCYLVGEPSQTTGSSRLLAATLRGRPVGLLVDEVFGQRNFMSNDASAPELAKHSPFAGLIRKQHRSGTDTWQELDLSVLFSQPEFLDGSAA